MSFLLNLPIRVVMLVFVLLFSIIGVSAPFLVVKRGDADILSSQPFDLMQCFAVGLICGVAMLHILADAQEDLSEVSDFPVAGSLLLLGCFSMVSLNRMVTLVAARHNTPQSLIDPMYMDEARSVHGSTTNVHGSTTNAADAVTARQNTPAGTRERPMSRTTSGSFHGHVHQRLILDPASSSRGVRIKAYLLEIAIALHSVLVGLSVGIIDEDYSEQASIDVITLGIAVCFHQLFEGIAVGNQGVRVGLSGRAGKFMVFLFSISCPLGGLLGIVIASSLDTDSPKAHWIIGSLNAFAAGTLIEIGCVDLLPELFSHKHGHQERISLRAESYRLIALVLGSVVMAILAIWA